MPEAVISKAVVYAIPCPRRLALTSGMNLITSFSR